MLPVVAIIGRPNVGKSTLFNRLTRTRDALVDDRPGVTRDRLYGTAVYGDREIVLVDTGGFEPDPSALPEGALFLAVRKQAEVAIREADVILFVVDRQVGMTEPDRLTAEILRGTLGGALGERRILLVVNKCDGPRHDDEAHEFWGLGFPEMACVSAEHGRGIYELWEGILARLPAPPEGAFDEGALEDVDLGFEPAGEGEGDEESEDAGFDAPANAPFRGRPDEIRIAVIGRPNIGKSTLVNRLLGEERHVVHDMPGTTVDAVDSVFEENGLKYRIVDTAGVRRRARIDDKLETFATLRAIKTIERCHVTLFLVDGVEGITRQDARLAALIEDRGRACILVVNRWDLVRGTTDRSSQVVDDEIRRHLPHLLWAPVMYTSALTGKGTGRILPLVEDVFRAFDRRISTARLNRFLTAAVAAHAPAQKHHHPVRLNYMTQTRVRPPTFTIWGNSPEAVKPEYRRFLDNRLREEFDFIGTPLRMHLKEKRRPGEAPAGA